MKGCMYRVYVCNIDYVNTLSRAIGCWSSNAGKQKPDLDNYSCVLFQLMFMPNAEIELKRHGIRRCILLVIPILLI